MKTRNWKRSCSSRTEKRDHRHIWKEIGHEVDQLSERIHMTAVIIRSTVRKPDVW